MAAPKRQMNLTAFFFPPSQHSTGWRVRGAVPGMEMDLAENIRLAQVAERGKFDTIFFQDTVASAGSEAMAKGDTSGTHHRVVKLESMTLLAALAMVTKHIGLISTATTTYNDPYLLARKVLTIDHISGGRAGWNLVTSQVEEEAQNFGRDAHLDHALRYERAGEFYDVVTGLWDSWEDGALVHEKASGRYYDAGKVHLLNHKGKHFTVRGPLNVPRSPQGRPIVAQAGSSEAGKEMAAKGADIVFTAQTRLQDAQEFYGDLKGRMPRYGRNPDHLKIMPGITFITGRTESDARALAAELEAVIDDDVAIRGIARLCGDLNIYDYDPDGPLPELPPSNAAKARQQMLIDLARRENLSIRQVARAFTQASGHNLVVGSPQQIADMMEHWFMEGGADGYTIMSPYLSHPLEDFTDLVIPELQRRGLFRTEYPGTTLRETLGIPVPENRHASARLALAGE